MKLTRWSILIALILAIQSGDVFSQNSMILDVSFDDCTASDLIGGQDGTVMGSPVCGCGVMSDALMFDGIDDHVFFPDSLNSVFENDFTIAFYLKLQISGDEPIDIFSHRLSCERDSSLAIRFIPITNQLSIEFAESVSRITEVSGTIEQPGCWTYVTITKSSNMLRLYIDGVLRESELFGIPLVVRDSVSLAISNSPCLGLTDQRMVGAIDEFRIYSRVLGDTEVAGSDLRPDKIISNDTTIILGNNVPILTGGTCADNFNWSPQTGLTDFNTSRPVATPQETTVYNWTTQLGSCNTTDSIRINVVNQGDVRCDDLLLPNAFTPNMDGVNDNFGISNVFLIDELRSFEIYDKWGSRVFQTSIKHDNWDGGFGGSILNPGTYIYKVRYTCGGQEYFKSGSLVMIR